MKWLRRVSSSETLAGEARAHIRALDRFNAMRIFEGLHRYAIIGQGDVKTLQGKQRMRRIWPSGEKKSR